MVSEIWGLVILLFSTLSYCQKLPKSKDASLYLARLLTPSPDFFVSGGGGEGLGKMVGDSGETGGNSCRGGGSTLS